MKTIYVIGAHPSHNPSMKRYSRLLESGYAASGFHVVPLAPTDRLSRRFPRAPRKWIAYIEKFVVFPQVLRKIPKGSAVHIADHSDAPFLRPIRRRTNQTITTCHDLIAIRAARGEIPEHRTRWTGRILQALIRSNLRRSGQILAVSETTAIDVQRLLGRQATIVKNPLHKPFENLCSERLTSPYLLIVSTIGWRKRRDLAIKAWLDLRRDWPADLRLVIVGPPLSDIEVQLIEHQGVDMSGIEVCHGISDEAMRDLYRNAAALLQCSKYEGFCWPIIEANSQSTVAICADEPILRETGRGNIFTDFSDGWTESVLKTLLSLKAADRSRLRERALSFSQAGFEGALRDAALTQADLV